MKRPIGRRDFLRMTAVVSSAAMTGLGTFPTLADEKKPRLKKAVKYAMVNLKGSHREKLELVKKCGFLGVEIDSPGTDRLEELARASLDTGITVHGAIDSVHWSPTHCLSHPDEAVRARGLEALKGALQDAKTVGATTVLLVPGVVREETYKGKKEKVSYEQCWERSQAEVKKALPLAEKLGVKIAIEVVWNNFITKPEQLIEYIDSYKNDWIGAYFDCSNMVKYGVPSADWIRKLGKRMLKFDFKGYNKERGWVPIGEGDENWPDIVKALEEIGYHGWATAEVASGGEAWLKEVSGKMDKILEL